MIGKDLEITAGTRINPFGMFYDIRIPKPIFENTDLSWSQKMCYAILMKYNGKKNNCYVGSKTIAKYMNQTTRHVKRMIADLEEKKFIRRVYRGMVRYCHFLWHPSFDDYDLRKDFLAKHFPENPDTSKNIPKPPPETPCPDEIPDSSFEPLFLNPEYLLSNPEKLILNSDHPASNPDHPEYPFAGLEHFFSPPENPGKKICAEGDISSAIDDLSAQTCDKKITKTNRQKLTPKGTTTAAAAVFSGDSAKSVAAFIIDGVVVGPGLLRILRNCIAKKGIEYVHKNILYTNKHIRNKGKYRAYLDKCLRENWGEDIGLPAKQFSLKAKRLKQYAEKNRQIEEEQKVYEQKKNLAEAKEMFLTLTEDIQKDIMEDFLNQANDFDRSRAMKSGLKKITQNISFLGYLTTQIEA